METPPVIEQLVADCRAALADDDPQAAVHRLVTELVADPCRLAAQVPRFDDDDVATSPRGFRLGGEHVAHRDDTLTVMLLDTLPGVVQPAHEHRMPVVIGVFEGVEEQRFWARTSGGIAPTPGRELRAGDVLVMGSRGIHAISSPPDAPARAVHVYLGDIYEVERSVFDPDSLAEHPMTSDRYDSFCRPDPRQ